MPSYCESWLTLLSRICSLVSEVVCQDLRHTACKAFPRFDVQKLIRSMRIRVGPEQSCNKKLGVRKDLAEHAHERDRSTRAHVHRRFAEERCGRFLH